MAPSFSGATLLPVLEGIPYFQPGYAGGLGMETLPPTTGVESWKQIQCLSHFIFDEQ